MKMELTPPPQKKKKKKNKRSLTQNKQKNTVFCIYNTNFINVYEHI